MLITMAHPSHVDILALVNTLASSLGRSDSGSASGMEGSQTCTSTTHQGSGGSGQLVSHDGAVKEECPLLARS